MITHEEADSNGNIFFKGWPLEDAVVSEKDKKILRDLAKKLSDLAARPQEAEKIKLWKDHNSLQETRPLLFFDAEHGWNEILNAEYPERKCEGRMAQIWEQWFYKEFLWAEKVKDDKQIMARFYLPFFATDSSWGISKKIIGDAANGEAYTWEHPITEDMMEDESLDFSTIIKTPQIHVDTEAVKRYTEIAHDVFDGILEVRRRHWWFWSLGLTVEYAGLRGLDNMMTDFYDYPERVHEIMKLFVKGHMAKLDYLEEHGLLTTNADNCYVGSGGIGLTDELNENADPVKTMDMWGLHESQETSEVSPEMFAEFVLPYHKILAERFGLNCCGCCEGLDKRWQYVRQIPRLRRVSVSQWADMAAMSDYLKSDYVFSYKNSPTDLAVPQIDEEYIRKNLVKVLKKTRSNNNRVEFIMKDNHTLANNPHNIYRWVELAREEIANNW